MRYALEHCYWRGKDCFDVERIIRSAVLGVLDSCDYYYAEIMVPMKGVEETVRKGTLPEQGEARRVFAKELFDWVFKNSVVLEIFTLYLDERPIAPGSSGEIIFSHDDDTCCWALHLTDTQYSVLLAQLEHDGLPVDLFYPESAVIWIEKKDGILGWFGFTREYAYSPREWAAKSEAERAEDLKYRRRG